MSSSTEQDPYATFRPITGAWVARACALASVIIFGAIAVVGPTSAGVSSSMALLDRGLIAGLGLALGAGLWRYSQIRAEPTPEGLVVVNLVRKERLDWNQILRVSFSDGAPWVVLELTDTEEIAVMAIQRADGRKARCQASRLAALVAHHQR